MTRVRSRLPILTILLATYCLTGVQASTKVSSTLTHLPLSFEPSGAGSLIAHQRGYQLEVERQRTTLTVWNARQHRTASVVTELVNAIPGPSVEGTDLLAARANYLQGSDAQQWRSNIPLYSRSVSRNIYPGIDLVFHGESGALEYDFVLQPGADYRRIALRVSGASSLSVGPDGSLRMNTEAGEIRWKKPEVYQVLDGVRHPISGAFSLHGRKVSFALGEYDRRQVLVIDPTLNYATYLGGSDDEGSRGIAVDSTGNIYVAGFTFSNNLPHTGGSYQQSFRGGTPMSILGGDVFVAKYAQSGSLIYVTYLGGNSDEAGSAIAVDSSGNAYVTGYTESRNFPTTAGALQTSFQGSGPGDFSEGTGGDAFVAKLNSSGSALLYSTYLGGSSDDRGAAIAVDSAGNAYIGGATLSPNFPTGSAYQATFKGAGGQPPLCTSCGPLINNGDGFLTKLNPQGSALVFSTYLGGKLDDGISSLALDASANVYVGGMTVSTDFPTLNAYQSQFKGTAPDSLQPVIKTGDGFVTKFDTTGKLVYSTYLGGSYDDAVMGLAVDRSGAVYVTGFTSSIDFPVSTVAPQKNYRGPNVLTQPKGFLWGDAFVSKLGAGGNTLVYSTLLGGTDDDAGMAIAVDTAGNAYVGGFANSLDFPLQGAVQKTFGGSGRGTFYATDPTGDGFVAQISGDGRNILFSTYFGGSADDAITGIALDAQANVYFAGASMSRNLATSSGAEQKAFGGVGQTSETMGDAFMGIYAGISAGGGTITSVLNAGTLDSRISAGTLVLVSGNNLGSSASAGVLVGGQSAQALAASSTLWFVLIPSTASAGATTIQVAGSAPFNITLTAYAPTLWSSDSDAAGVSATHATGNAPVTASNPALPGETIALSATGLGPTNASGSPTGTVTVTVGGTAATVSSVGPASAESGLNLVTVQLPTGLAAGNPAVVLSIGGVSSNSLKLPVGGGSSSTGPSITEVDNGASFAPGIVANAWLTIKGKNLSAVTDTWSNSIVNGQLPTTLDGVSVKVGGQSAYVQFVSPEQVNVLAPNITAGPQQVTVTNSSGTTAPATATAQIYGPAFFLWPGGYVVASRNSDYTFAVKDGTFPGFTTAPAKPGDVIILWGTGFGPTTPAAPIGAQVPGSGSYLTASPVTVTIGGNTVQYYGTALSPGFAALYQVAIQIPAGLADGDYPIVASVGGVQSPSSAKITVQH